MQTRIPIYQLYGEYLARAENDHIFHEMLKERSKKHNWNISQHQHEKLAQIFFFETSGVSIDTMEAKFRTTEPSIILVPPMTVHGFLFPEDARGDVINLRVINLQEKLSECLSQFKNGTAIILTQKNAKHFDAIVELIKQVRRIYRNASLEQPDILDDLVMLILKYIGTETGPAITRKPSATEQSNHELKALAFCDHVETSFTDGLKVEDYAKDLNISSPQLTRITNKILNTTPNAYIMNRRLVEAKRLLRFTRHTIADITERCGFKDISYFSKAFKTTVGQTPKEYRRRAGD